MYNNQGNWYNQYSAIGGDAGQANQSLNWVQQAGYQTDRSGFGFKPQSGAAVLASLDDKVADADAKLRDFMAEIESLDDGATTTGAAADKDSGLARSTVPGFISGGHVLPASTSDKDTDDVGVDVGDPLVEPTTTWQHLMDENTKHYYYWNTVTNAVTWTIPQEYTEYLVKHKLYREALSAGRKTMPSLSKQTAKESNKSANESATVKADVSEINSSTEIGPQLPPNLKSKLLASASNEEKVADSADTAVTPPHLPLKSLGVVAGYNTDDDSETETDSISKGIPEPPAKVIAPPGDTSVSTANTNIPPGGATVTTGVAAATGTASTGTTASTGVVASTGATAGTGVLKSLVAYGDSFVNDDEDDDAVENESCSTTKDHTPSNNSTAQDTQSMDVTTYSEALAVDQYSNSLYNGDATAPITQDMYNCSQDSELAYSQAAVLQNSMYGSIGLQGEQFAYGAGNVPDAPLDFGPTSQDQTSLVYGTANQDSALTFTEQQEVPLIFKGAPPPPPPPPEEPGEEEKDASGLSSVEITEYSSVILDKLEFLDVNVDNMSKLQTLLMQMKTRLDDWQAGGLSKQYLIEKLEETDGLLEVCESESAPAGWRCNWSRKEKQYYYIHEITEELSWTYPEEDVEAVCKLASKHKSKSKGEKQKSSRMGTLSQLTQAIEAKTVDADLKALFIEKIIDKCAAETLVSKLNDAGEKARSPVVDSEPDTAKLAYEKIKPCKVDNDITTKKSKASKRPYSDYSDDDSVSDKTHKSKKSKHHRKTEKSEKKSKKHSKHKKSKSANEKKKSKHKRHRSRSSSSGASVELVSVNEPSAELIALKEKLNRHKQKPLETKPRARVPTSVKPKMALSSTSKVEVSPLSDKPTIFENKNTKIDDNQLKQDNDNVDSVDSNVTKPDLVVADTPKPIEPEPVVAVSDHDSVDEMDISPLSSPERSLSPPGVTNIELKPVSSLTDLPKTESNATVSPPKTGTITEPKNEQEKPSDSIDDLLASIEKEAQLDLERQSTKAPPPPPGTEELPPPSTTEPAQYSKAAAPVFYQQPAWHVQPTSNIPAVVAHTPVLYTQASLPATTQVAPNVSMDTSSDINLSAGPTLAYPSPTKKAASPVRFPSATSAATSEAGASRQPVKEKHRAKKSKKSKMPAALVQKWQKVQSEISTDMLNEKKLKEELLK